MEEEHWKPLEGFSNYLFSNIGNIKRISDGRIEPTTLSGVPRYYYVHLVPDGGKRSLYRLHRLIAMVWIPRPDDPEMNMVDHINRDRLDNRVENLRWICRSGNQKNRDVAYFAVYKGFWVHVKTFYKDDIAAYSYAYQNRHLSNDLEELESIRNSPNHRKTVVWEGEERLLVDLCEEFDKDYEVVSQRLNNWTDATVYACMFYDSPTRVNYTLMGKGGVLYEFSSLQEIADYLGVYIDRVKESLPLSGNKLETLKQIVANWKPKDPRKLYTIDGVSKHREGWIRHYETSEVRVSTNMTKYKIPFEEAVKLPVERVRKIIFNGETILVKDMWLKFGLNPKTCNRKKSHWKTGFKDTLSRLGIDTSEVEIIPI